MIYDKTDAVFQKILLKKDPVFLIMGKNSLLLKGFGI
jgi:hypothetical protein